MKTVNIDETGSREFIGRKLILHWGKLKIEISKLPYGNKPVDPLFDLEDSIVVLANVYKTADGRIEDEILGRPAGINGDGTCIEGRTIQDYFTEDEFWRTPNESG